MKILKIILKFIFKSISNSIYLIGCLFTFVILRFSKISEEKLLLIQTKNDILLLQQIYIKILITFLTLGFLIELIKIIFIKITYNKG